MMHDVERNVVLIVDNVDLDNVMAVMAACSMQLGLNVVAVIVTGRSAHPDRSAKIDEFSQEFSEKVRRLNTRRMIGIVERRAHFHAPVFEGLIAPRTLVPHRVHIDEWLLDFYLDEQREEVDWHFKDAIEYLASLQGPIDLVVGGGLLRKLRR